MAETKQINFDPDFVGAEQEVEVELLDQIVKRTIDAVEQSKGEIFDIYENARSEMENVRQDVERVKKETAAIIFKVDELEKREVQSRIRLAEVSSKYNSYSEEAVKRAYDEASEYQVAVALARAQEKSLRKQRDELELRLKSLKRTVEKAENLVSQVGVVLGYLGKEMGNVVVQLESLQQRQLFGSKIIQAQEEERRRVAREIHDGPAQSLVNVVFRTEVCERMIDSDIDRVKTELTELKQQVRDSLTEIRKIIFDLRPMALDDLGLVPTLVRLIDHIKGRTKISVELKIFGNEKRLDSYIEIGMFRIIQEALNNVEKHAKANTVIIKIEYQRSCITAVIEDNGRGFDVGSCGGHESFGLLGIRERVKLLHGDVHITSQPGMGTKILLKVPLV